MLDGTTIIGKVFHDRDGDGTQEHADATGLRVEGGIPEHNYVPGSTTVDLGEGPEAVEDDGVPLVRGIVEEVVLQLA